MKPLYLTIFAAALLVTANVSASAQTAATPYPERTVRIVVPFPAGGATDIVARATAERLSTAWKQPVVIENVAGAAGAIGSAQVARAPRDGYTLLTGVGTTTAILKTLKSKLAFDPINDFAPISLMATFPNILVVRGDFPAGNVKELIDAARANPGKFTYASSGYGSSIHLGAELFKLTTRTDIVHVPYTGSAPAVTALLGGHVDMMIVDPSEAGEQIRAGKFRAIAQVTERRLPGFPDIPTIKEAGFDIPDVPQMRGVVGAAGMSDATIAYYEDMFLKASQTPMWKKFVTESQLDGEFVRAKELKPFLTSFEGTLRDILKDAGVKVIR
jgi:tripartite-type tricarboxylate transporter receptor subunit TctC